MKVSSLGYSTSASLAAGSFAGVVANHGHPLLVVFTGFAAMFTFLFALAIIIKDATSN